MIVTADPQPLSCDAAERVRRRAQALFTKRYVSVCRRTDRMFVYLMLLQWLVAIAMSAWLSPMTWSGRTPSIHVHVIAAIGLGGIITALPLALYRLQPGHALTRHVVAVAQVSWSALLIHFSGGRIETHFHIFGSLAILAFYRDLKVLIPATLVVAADHFVRGVYWPESIYGVLNPEWWRFLEHAGWVIFIDLFLVFNCHHSRRDLRKLCEHQANLEAQQEARLSAARHAAVERARASAERDRNEANARAYEQLSDAHRRLGEMQRDLVHASRQAGMAEIATTVLHNVGNSMNSINVSAELVQTSMDALKVDRVGKLAAMLDEHRGELGNYLAERGRGDQVIALLRALTQQLEDQRAQANVELAGLCRHVDHVKAVIRSQQDAAMLGGVTERIAVTEVVDDALALVSASVQRHGIELVRKSCPDATVTTDRHRLLQIVANLVSNATQALRSHDGPRRLEVEEQHTGEAMRVVVSDSGPGIPSAIRDKIFQYGFTTKQDGHGFGLHSSALLANELGGSLRLEAPVAGRGARFILELPAPRAEAA